MVNPWDLLDEWFCTTAHTYKQSPKHYTTAAISHSGSMILRTEALFGGVCADLAVLYTDL